MTEALNIECKGTPGSPTTSLQGLNGIETLQFSFDFMLQPSIRSIYPLERLLNDLEEALSTSLEIAEALNNLYNYGAEGICTYPFISQCNSDLRFTSELFATNPEITPGKLFQELNAQWDEFDLEWFESMRNESLHQECINRHDCFRLGHQAFLTVLARLLAKHDKTLTHKGSRHA